MIVPDPPFWMSVRGVARSFGIPPWQLEHPERPPTEWEVTCWFLREDRLRGLGL